MDKHFEAIELNELHTPSCRVLYGSCLDRLKEIPDASIDAVVCDPPYHLQSIVKRLGKPDAAPINIKETGVYARASRGFMGQTWDGGDIAFKTDVWRECLRVLKAGGHLVAFGGTRTVHRIACAIEDSGFEIRDMISWLYFSGFPKSLNIVSQLEDSDSIFWSGYGTALKPAQEPAILARKPIEERRITAQLLATGTGAINIDGCRFAYGDPCWVGPNEDVGQRKPVKNTTAAGYDNKGSQFQKNTSQQIIYNYSSKGRWPANIYQCAKPSRAEKEQGLEHLEPTTGAEAVGRTDGSAGLNNPRAGAGRTAAEIRNIHPTVKPLKLMRWLVRLVTPEGGTVLDPFAGSGTTLAAATLENRHSVGCELTADYLPIIHGRVQWARDEYYRENQQLVLPW